MGTVTNPLGSLIQGLLTGHNLGQQILQEQRQQEAFDRAQALQDQEGQIRDITIRKMLDDYGRPVTAGMVDDSMTMPEMKTDWGTTVGGDNPVQFKRKAQNTVKYKTRAGETLEYEPYSPEEQIRRQTEQAERAKRVGTIAIQTPEHLRALGLPETMYLDPERAYQFADSAGQLAPVQTPQAAQQAGLPATVRARDLSSVTNILNSIGNREASNQRTQATIDAANKRAEEDRKAADARLKVQEAGRDRRAASGNGRSLTPGQEGVQNRFNQRLLENDQKTLRDLQTKEDALHAEKIRLGQLPMVDQQGKYSPSADQARKAKLAALDLQIKGIQASKQKLVDKWGGDTGQSTQAPTSGERVHVKLADGQTGWVDSAEYDPKTMVQIPK